MPLDQTLIAIRAIHFAATITVAGVVFFIVFIADPAFRSPDIDAKALRVVRTRFTWIAWIGLLLAAQVAVAIENARLYESSRQWARQLESLKAQGSVRVMKPGEVQP